jgi:DNA-binding CsgD family transcriptional regulator/tetratricopeptide (TPR) repeat protein
VDATAHFRTAIGLLGATGEPAQWAPALTGLGDAATLIGDYAQAVEAHRAACLRLGRAQWRQEAVAGAERAFERALELLGPADGPDAAEALLRLADLRVTSLGRNAEAVACAERALAMVERLGDRRLEATAWYVAGNVRARSNDLAAGQASLERALTLAQALDDPALAAEVCAHLANVCAWTADLDRARSVSILSAELARRTQDLFHLRHVYAWIGLQDVCQGRWADAERWFARQEPIVEGLQAPEPRASLRAFRGMLRYYRGRFEEAEREHRGAIALVRPTGSGTLLWRLGQQGLILAELGRRDEARGSLAELRALADALDERAIARLGAFAYLAVGYARLGERERAAGCYAPLLPYRGQFAPIPVDRALGLAALARGDGVGARRHLADAEAQARRAGMRPELALILLERGRLERDHRAGAAAGEPLSSAATGGPLAEELRPCAELGTQELGRRTLNPPSAGAGRRPDRDARVAGLSDRELEVLRLVAQGRTNREIAAALSLSENTVARHLTHILTRTGVENRAGAAAFALRHGLA